MSARAGIVTNQGLLPTIEDLANLGSLDGWIRILVVDMDMFDRDLQAMQWPDTVNICALLEGQTKGVGNDFVGWVPTIQEFAQRFKGRVQAVECANELDIWHWQPPENHDPDPKLTPAFAADLVRQASPILRGAGMKVIAPAVASGRWFDYLGEMSPLIGDAADWQAFHPYGKKIDNHPPNDGWQELREALDQAFALAGRPLALTELGVKVGEAGGFAGQAEYVKRLFGLAVNLPPSMLAFFCYFAWKDEVGIEGEGSFGLVEDDGSWRGACHEFQRCCGGRMPIPRRRPDRGTTGGGAQPEPQTGPVFKLGFKDWASREPQLIGTPGENESSPFPKLSVQRTTRGLLLWMDSGGDAYLFEDFVSSGRFIWRKEWNASQRAPTGTNTSGPESDPVFKLGFKDWADKEPDLLGKPLENESGPFDGISLQRTDRGLLVWTNSDGDAYLFEDWVNGGCFIRRPDWPSSQKL
jgi:hypothetical protein